MEKPMNSCCDQILNQNEKLLIQLFICQKSIEILEKFRYYLQNIINNCECHEISRINRQDFNDLENEYNIFNKNKEILFTNEEINSFEFNTNNETIIKIRETFQNTNNESTDNSMNINHNNLTLDLTPIFDCKDKSTSEIQKRDVNQTKEPKSNKNLCKSQETIKVDNICDSKLNSSKVSNNETKAKPYVCSQCNKCYETPKLLKSHQRVVHCEERRFKCTFAECQVKMKTKQQINQHIKIHYEDRPYACEWPGCQFRCKQLQNLKTHTLRHKGDKAYKCTECDKSFISSAQLQNHKIVHVKEKKFKCVWPGCEYGAKRSSDLTKHLATLHSNEKNYICDWPGCGYRCKTSSGLNGHKVVHKNEKKYCCDWPKCGKKFPRSSRLRQHLMIHRGEKPFKCDWAECEMRFVEAGNMRKHYRTHLKK